MAEASRLSGVSRDTIYRHRKLIKQGGIESLKLQETPDFHHKNCTDRAIEVIVINMSSVNPHMGLQKISMRMKAEFGIDISANGVRNMWLRNQLNTA